MILHQRRFRIGGWHASGATQRTTRCNIVLVCLRTRNNNRCNKVPLQLSV